MTAEDQTHSSPRNAIQLSPWLVVLGALILYGITVHHWVTDSSLPLVARVTGWDWHPQPLSWRPTDPTPLYLLLTLPARILPASWIPFLLNLFAVLCAAGALGLLAASVRLLPQDRTREQRQREGGEFALLSVPLSFIPPLFAVLMLALNLGFWRKATVATGDMLDLLVFAFLIYSLLRYRISQNDTWLSAFAFIYGLGTTNNWALIGFFPLFVIALVWIMGVNFFNLKFLARMLGWGLLGLLLYLPIPAISSLSGERANFWEVLRLELGSQSFGLRMIPRWIVIVAALPTLLPLLFAGIKWPSFEGELSAAGSGLTKMMFRMLHVVFLLLALVMFFDFKFSPSLRLADAPISFLTFYYVGALCIGYYSGYILLVFGKNSMAWEKTGAAMAILNIVCVVGLYVIAVGAPIWLLVKTLPNIKADYNTVLADFTDEMINDLPKKPAVLLCDDSIRLYQLDAAYARKGRKNDNIVIETSSLQYRDYYQYLLQRYPELQKQLPPASAWRRQIPSELLIRLIYTLNTKYPLYYLHPSFGYYFEVYYLKPHGLVYELLTYAKETVDRPAPSPEEIQENQAVWARVKSKVGPKLAVDAKLSADLQLVADTYSVDLNYWGVTLQKANRLSEANAAFAQAVALHPNNFIARINLKYNEQLQKGDHRTLDTEDLIYKAANYYRGVVPILKYNGPSDEPGLNQQFGTFLAQGHNFRQAAILFERRQQLLPDDPVALMDLAKTYVDWGAPDKALQKVARLRAIPSANKWDVTRVEALAYLGKKDHATAERILQNAYKEMPSDESRSKTLLEFYRVTGYEVLRQSNEANRPKDEVLKLRTESGRRFTNALIYLDTHMEVLKAATHNSYNPEGLPDDLLKRAEILMVLRQFKDAIVTLNKVLEIQPKNTSALLNRAVAETQLENYPVAIEDYKDLRRLLGKDGYIVDYGLADIASRQTNTDEELRCLKRYLAKAPEDSSEFQQAKRRLTKLELH